MSLRVVLFVVARVDRLGGARCGRDGLRGGGAERVGIPNSNIYNYIYITLLGGGSEDNPWRGWRQKDAEGHRQLLNINVGLNESNCNG